MERTKKVEEKPSGKIHYKKIGGGSLRLNHQIIKPGEIFLAFPKDIPKAWGDVVIPLDALPVTDTPVEKIKGTISAYTLEPRGKSKVWVDVVDSKGKVLNDKALKREDAEQLIKDLAK